MIKKTTIGTELHCVASTELDDTILDDMVRVDKPIAKLLEKDDSKDEPENTKDKCD